jgi:hypothetical protein
MDHHVFECIAVVRGIIGFNSSCACSCTDLVDNGERLYHLCVLLAVCLTHSTVGLD